MIASEQQIVSASDHDGSSLKVYLLCNWEQLLKPDDIVVCDNLSGHKMAEVQAISEAHGATIK